MSMPVKITVACSKCRGKYQTTIYNSINTNFSKDVPEQIMSGKLFDSQCPHCKFINHLEYEILYNDMSKNAMVWVVSPQFAGYEQRLSEVRSAPVHMYSITRVVNTTNELREKVSCLYSGRDDRAIELCKLFLRIQLIATNSDFECVKAFYAFQNGEEIFFFYDKDGNELFTKLDPKLYSIMVDFLRTQEIRDGIFSIYDEEWAESVFPAFLEYSERVVEGNDTKDEREQEGVAKEKPPIRFCRICGERLLDNSLFCSYCGTKVRMDECHS